MTIEALTQTAETIAMVRGEPITTLPKDLYIPPDALEVFLETFTGPLDILLYLIKKQNFDILDIPIAEITRQYVQYIELMQEMRLELAAEYLVMAAMLAEIKSRCLLPRPVGLENHEESDPRAELIRRLQEYERIKKGAEDLEKLPQHGRDVFLASVQRPEIPVIPQKPTIDLNELTRALQEVLRRAALTAHHQIKREHLSIRERMSQILTKITDNQPVQFTHLFKCEEGRMGVVVTFIAILELLKQTLIVLMQDEPYGAIQVQAISPATSA